MSDISGDVERAVAEMFNMNKRATLSDEDTKTPSCEKSPSEHSIGHGLNLSSDALLILGLVLILLDGCDDKLLLFALIYLIL